MSKTDVFWKNYIPAPELKAIEEGLDGEEGKYFQDLLKNLRARIEQIPRLYETEHEGKTAIARLHYFAGGTDIFITELNPETGEAFGYTCLNGDRENAELGYISLPELVSIDIMQLDLHFDDNITIQDIIRNYGPQSQKSTN